jgi:hypothetical protein
MAGLGRPSGDAVLDDLIFVRQKISELKSDDDSLYPTVKQIRGRSSMSMASFSNPRFMSCVSPHRSSQMRYITIKTTPFLAGSTYQVARQCRNTSHTRGCCGQISQAWSAALTPYCIFSPPRSLPWSYLNSTEDTVVGPTPIAVPSLAGARRGSVILVEADRVLDAIVPRDYPRVPSCPLLEGLRSQVAAAIGVSVVEPEDSNKTLEFAAASAFIVFNLTTFGSLVTLQHHGYI